MSFKFVSPSEKSHSPSIPLPLTTMAMTTPLNYYSEITANHTILIFEKHPSDQSLMLECCYFRSSNIID